MEADKVLTSSILDILFEGRNKEYGAYELRKHHNRRVLMGLLGVAIITGLLFIVNTLAQGHVTRATASMMITDVQLEEVQVVKKIEPPPAPIQPIKVEQVKFTAPKIVKDDEVKANDRPPEQERLADTKIGAINQEGVKDSGFVAPPASDGNGKGIVEAPGRGDDNGSDRIFTKVEIESQYPGGVQAWMRYLNRNFRYPDDAINNEIQGTVLVQFIVDQVGNVSDVQAISGPDAGGLRDEAIRVIRKSGQWLPAIQNGSKVKSYKKQPVIFMMAPQ
jgi:periplasmic protein TonB